MFKIALALCLRLYHPHPAYTTQDWDKELQAEQVCQCITIKVSPEGSVMGTSRACRCDE